MLFALSNYSFINFSLAAKKIHVCEFCSEVVFHYVEILPTIGKHRTQKECKVVVFFRNKDVFQIYRYANIAEADAVLTFNSGNSSHLVCCSLSPNQHYNTKYLSGNRFPKYSRVAPSTINDEGIGRSLSFFSCGFRKEILPQVSQKLS